MTTKIRKLCAFAAFAAMCVMRPALADVDWNSGRILVDADYEGTSNIGANGDTVVFQDDHSVTIKGSPYIGTSAATAVPASPNIVESEEGVMWWDAGERIFYARRHADGLFLIFR